MGLPSVDRDKKTARKKGIIAAGAAAASVGAAIAVGPILGLVGGAAAAYLTYDWFKFRAKRGMRF